MNLFLKAGKNFQNYIESRPFAVKRKKYIHVVRRLLLHRWLQLSERSESYEMLQTHIKADSDHYKCLLWPPPSNIMLLLRAVILFKQLMSRSDVSSVTDQKSGSVPRQIPPDVFNVIQKMLNPCRRRLSQTIFSSP